MVRTEYDSSSSADMALRTSLLFRVAKELKWISDIFKVCIVVINQVCNHRDEVQCYQMSACLRT